MRGSAPAYDRIGVGYASRRQPDARIAARILDALGPARSILNVGAGTGSYEPTGRDVIAVEPSAVMIAQRAAGSAPAIQARAEQLPVRDDAVDAVMGVLTLHHWQDVPAGLAECARVARDRVVFLTWDPESAGFWLVQEYFPEFLELDRRIFPTIGSLSRSLGPLVVTTVPVPHDCVDGFLGAYWQRPEAYLDPSVRAAISSFARTERLEQGLDRLRKDLLSGQWAEGHADLLARDALDVGYRLVTAEL